MGAMRVGYFGGSFDPPHRGHLAVACAARDRFALDRVLLAPTGRQPLKPDGAHADFADRLTMTTLLCEGQPALEASAVDAPHPGGGSNYTVEALAHLRESLPSGARLFSIVGADAFRSLPQWRDPERLLQLAEWIVVSRPGTPMTAVSALEALPFVHGREDRIHTLSDLADPASATRLREELLHGGLEEHLLPPQVLAYIRQRHLYGVR